MSKKLTINNPHPRIRCIKEAGLYPALNAIIELNLKEENTVVDLDSITELTDEQYDELLAVLVKVRNN